MYIPSGQNDFSSVIILGFIVCGLIGVVLHKFSVLPRLRNLIDKQDTPNITADGSLLISFFSAGHTVLPLTRNKGNGLRYSLLFTLPDNTRTSYVNNEAVIESLDMPFNTQTHLVGLSKQHALDRIEFENFVAANGMEKVELEGDFQEYFDIYAIKGQQFQVRYVLNPEAMDFVINFCRSHFWEISNSEFYIVATKDDKSNDNILDDSQKFVTAIKPALLPGDPNAPAVHHEVPYGEYDGPALLCPICQKAMTLTDKWQACPDGHGILINGRYLAQLHHQELSVDPLPNNPMAHGPLTCPNCKHPMEGVDFEDSGVTIDTCTNCVFRWLDANEVAEISSGKKVLTQAV